MVFPVKFTLFTVTLKNNDAVLNWNAAQDEALSHYVIQRSTDGTTYTDIATVFASASMNYAYTDKNVNTSTSSVYYRIVGVDKTKATAASTVKMIRLTKAEAASIAIAAFPNPVVNDLRITLPAAWQGKAVTFEVYNTAGTLAKATQASNASQIENITVSNLTKGFYMIKAICGGETAAQRIVKN